jgi:hypothetical protein
MKKTPHTIEPPVERKKASGLRARFARFAGSEDVPAPSREEARRRIRSKPGFFESLSPEARSAIAMYDGPEAMGPPRQKK